MVVTKRGSNCLPKYVKEYSQRKKPNLVQQTRDSFFQELPERNGLFIFCQMLLNWKEKNRLSQMLATKRKNT